MPLTTDEIARAALLDPRSARDHGHARFLRQKADGDPAVIEHLDRIIAADVAPTRPARTRQPWEQVLDDP